MVNKKFIYCIGKKKSSSCRIFIFVLPYTISFLHNSSLCRGVCLEIQSKLVGRVIVTASQNTRLLLCDVFNCFG